MNNLINRLIKCKGASTHWGWTEIASVLKFSQMSLKYLFRSQELAFDRLDLDAWVDHYRGVTDALRIGGTYGA